MSNNYYYNGVNPTVDLIIVNPEGKILLIKRSEKANACPDMWAIPGGFIDTESKKGDVFKYGAETPEKAAVRELKEETNLFLINPQLISIGEFEGNNRDPRDTKEGWSKSHAFIYVIPKEIYEAQKDKIRGMDDAKEAKWMTIEEIESLDVAFDHKEIIRAGLAKLKTAQKLKM